MSTISGGEKLEAAMRELSRNISKPGTLKVGFLSEAKYPTGESVAMIAAINEFGRPSVGQPPRPFFRNLIAAKSREWPAAIAGLLKSNDNDAVKTLELTGSDVAGQLRQSIVDLMEPPLAPSTIRRKGFDKPLIDTGHMLARVDYEVKS